MLKTHQLAASIAMHFHLVGRYELADAGNAAHLALFGHAGQALGELADHFLLVAAQSIEHDLWRAEADAVIGGMGGFVDHRGGMQQGRSEEHTSELQSLMRISYAVFCLK